MTNQLDSLRTRLPIAKRKKIEIYQAGQKQSRYIRFLVATK
jgi:hypothetical protein